MAEVVRIVIKGSSGYGPSDEAYKDKLTITSSSIAYEYLPYEESVINPKRAWNYKTNSPIFKVTFGKVAAMLPDVLAKDPTMFCTDIGEIECIITYADKTKRKELFWLPGDDFKELFHEIKFMVPECEYTPAVLLTEEDYEDEVDNE